MKKTYTLGLAVLAVALPLSACSGSTDKGSESGEAQTTEQACDIIYSGMQTLSDELAEVSSGDSGEDVQAMVEAADKSLDKLTSEVTNPEVKELWDPIAKLQREGLQAAADENQEELMAAYSEMSEKYEALTEVCPNVADGETQS